ncbi:hypothetical protein [Chitinophaga eiseniae]|uniref:Fimbrillin-A associated anchor protein Mfa1 and Mfa2 n=1 Tax=Chitinophaga eiseniae TaxID=634771 RepID=A0A847SG80_9BACT|nr:hypothetical protein [Chitinophaga eiseniae]NLR78005.1 hypothetical protein [Chitinophaga eiseniae]
MRTRLYKLALCGMIASIFACNKDVQPEIPANGNISKINFYSSSDVLALYNMGGIGLFIDSPVVKRNGLIPFFNLSASPQKKEYPTVYSSMPSIVYTSFRDGKHQFRFNYMVPDTTTTMEGILPHRMLIDSSISFDRGREMLCYLADKPLVAEGQEPAFQLLHVQLEGTAQNDANTVSLYILHQAADAGLLRCSSVLPDGSLSTEKVPQSLAYGQTTAAITFNTKDASNGLFGLRFYDATTGQELVNTAIPANGGHAYILAIQGFKTAHQFKIPVSVNQDKTVNYSTKTVTANLRSDLRQLW